MRPKSTAKNIRQELHACVRKDLLAQQRGYINFLQQQRLKQNLSYNKLAIRSGLDVSTVFNTLKHATKEPSFQTMASIAGALGFHFEAV